MYNVELKPHSFLKPTIVSNGVYGLKINMDKECMQLNSIPIRSNGVVNCYIVFDLDTSIHNDNDPTIKSCLFGEVEITNNSDIEKYKYKGFGIGMDGRSRFSFGSSTGQNIIIFGVDMSSTNHIDNRGKNILILGRGPTQGLIESSLTTEKIFNKFYWN